MIDPREKMLIKYQTSKNTVDADSSSQVHDYRSGHNRVNQQRDCDVHIVELGPKVAWCS